MEKKKVWKDKERNKNKVENERKYLVEKYFRKINRKNQLKLPDFTKKNLVEI
ncbi:MAG: hypothetical protein Q4E24_02935 [bacterium]|nr:hypothetical protein [bacterium]